MAAFSIYVALPNTRRLDSFRTTFLRRSGVWILGPSIITWPRCTNEKLEFLLSRSRLHVREVSDSQFDSLGMGWTRVSVWKYPCRRKSGRLLSDLGYDRSGKVFSWSSVVLVNGCIVKLSLMFVSLRPPAQKIVIFNGTSCFICP